MRTANIRTGEHRRPTTGAASLEEAEPIARISKREGDIEMGGRGLMAHKRGECRESSAGLVYSTKAKSKRLAGGGNRPGEEEGNESLGEGKQGRGTRCETPHDYIAGRATPLETYWESDRGQTGTKTLRN